MLPCAFPARSRFPMLPCAFPAWKCFLACSCFPIALRIGTSAGSCFPMLPQRLPLEHLPRSSFRTAATRGAVTSSAQTSASLHPPAALRLRVLPFTRAWTPTVCAEEFPTPLERSICQIVSVHWIAAAQTDPNLSAHLHRLPTPPLYLRQMRLLPGRGRRCWMLDEAGALPMSLHR